MKTIRETGRRGRSRGSPDGRAEKLGGLRGKKEGRGKTPRKNSPEEKEQS